MSLLKRIESARPGSGPGAVAPDGGGSNLPAPVGAPPAVPGPSRLASQGPVRESFRDVKFRIQSRMIQDLDPKLDLTNQVEVRRQIEEIFGRVIDEEGLALTRAERVRMLEQITDEIIGLGPLEPLLRDEPGGSERRKTLGSAVTMWKCFPNGRKFRNTARTTRWSQRAARPAACTAPGEAPLAASSAAPRDPAGAA